MGDWSAARLGRARKDAERLAAAVPIVLAWVADQRRPVNRLDVSHGVAGRGVTEHYALAALRELVAAGVLVSRIERADPASLKGHTSLRFTVAAPATRPAARRR